MDVLLALDAPPAMPALAEHQPVEFACDAEAGDWLELRIGGAALEPFLRPGERIWRWRWNPGAAVGLHAALLTARAPGGAERRLAWQIRVEPRKVDQERYEALLDDLQRSVHNLIYALGAGAEGAETASEAAWERSRLEEYYALLTDRLDALERAVRRIAARPREHLRHEPGVAPIGQAQRLDAAALAALAQGPFDDAPPGVADELQQALRPGGGLLPRDLPAGASRPSYDTYEHRLLKQLLTTLLRRARALAALAERETARLERGAAREARAREIAGGSRAAAALLRELRALPFLAEVGPLAAFRGPTPLLQREPPYREVYRAWLAVRRAPFLAFDSPLFSIPLADLPRLYESWCAVTVSAALLTLGGEIREQRLVEPGDEDGLASVAALVTDAPLLTLQRGDVTLTLRYQPVYRPGAASGRLGSLDRQQHVPDLAIERRAPGEPPQALLLDAKYRRDGEGLPPDAIADGYTYLGAIGVNGARATLGALLLYPGTGAPEHYRSGVGLVPLQPGNTDGLARLLRELLG